MARPSHGRRAVLALFGIALAGACGDGSDRGSRGEMERNPTTSQGPPDVTLLEGRSPVGGPWILTSYMSEKSASQPAGLPCLLLTLTEPTDVTVVKSSGFCGHQEDDFGAVSLPMIRENGDSEVMIVGIAPAGARSVELESSGGRVWRAPAQRVDSRFGAATVFLLPATVDPGNARLVARGEARQELGKPIDTSGFFEGLEQLERQFG